MKILLKAFQNSLEEFHNFKSQEAGKYKDLAEEFIEYVKTNHKQRLFKPLPLQDKKIAAEFLAKTYATKGARTQNDKREGLEYFQKFLSERNFGDRWWNYLQWLQEQSVIAIPFGILAFLSVIFGVITGTSWVIDQIREQSPTPIFQNSTQIPERMPANTFNVVIAGFGFKQVDGTIVESQNADDISDIVLTSLSELPLVDYIRGWHDPGVGHILESDPVKREREAAQIAEKSGADVVIYGIIHSDGIFVVLEPEFYITAQFASLEPELVGADTFGSPIEFVASSKDQINAATNLKKRLTVLRFFLRGLALYISGDFAESGNAFENAIAAEEKGLEVLYVFAGNAALRKPDIEHAITLYNTALTVRPNYARALVGRGIALYQLALEQTGDTPSPYQPDLSLDAKTTCNNVNEPLPEQPQLIAMLSLRCYREAMLSQDKPETADIDVKTAFGLGQVNVWLSLNHYGDYWNEAKTYLQQVLDLYTNSEPERQLRIRIAAAHANAWLGLRLLSIDGSIVPSVQQALGYYESAIALLQNDINPTYNQSWIDVYEKQVTALKDWLSQHTQTTSQPTSIPIATTG